MAYNDFAYWYDALNTEADYDRLVDAVVRIFQENDVFGGIVADLGCGTGEATLRLARAGYDMIAVDASPDMLSVFRDKLDAAGEIVEGQTPRILLLCQNLAELELYGTCKAAISTSDTFNHLPPALLQAAFERVALFVEPGGLLVFDVNTPYKHKQVLDGNTFVIEGEDGCVCTWRNRYDERERACEISIELCQGSKIHFAEIFFEYDYALNDWMRLLHENGFVLLDVLDGDELTPTDPETQRYLISARKQP